MKASTNPSKLTQHHVDLAPLKTAIIKAHKSHDWSPVEKMLEGDYSLLWLDTELGVSVTRLLASDAKTSHVIPQLLDFSRQQNGVNSDAHRFVLLEAAIGRIQNSNALALHDIAVHSGDMRKFYQEIEALADMGRQHIGHLVFANGEQPGIKPSAETVDHLLRGGHTALATDHLSAIVEHSPNQDELNSAIRAYIRGRLNRDNIDSMGSEIMTLLAREFPSKNRQINVLALTVAEALEIGCDEWALSRLEDWADRESEVDNYDADIFGEAIISAARSGRIDLVLKIIELAKKKKLEKNPRFQTLLACAAGAALTKEHYSTSKVVMLLSSRFSATERDMIELCTWPVKKIERLSRVLHDYKLFTEIVSHVINPEDKLRWVSALKQEYGLQEMSDAGFLSLLEHPEGLQKLFYDKAHKEVMADSFNDNHLSKQDLQVFTAVMNHARVEAQKPNHGKISFFRLCHLANHAQRATVSPEVLKRSLEVKNEIDVILNKFGAELLHTRESKQIVKACQAALSRANTPEKIAKVLRKYLGKLKNGKLLADCMAIVDKTQSVQSTAAPNKA